VSDTKSQASKTNLTRYESLPNLLKVVVVALTSIGIGLFIFYTYGWSIKGWVLDSTMYYYLLYVCFATSVFLTMSARRKDRNKVPWYDLILAAIVFGICVYFVAKSASIHRIGWVPPPSTLSLVLACVIGLLALESGRRMAGYPLVIICIIFGIYPLFAEHMPDLLYGQGFPFSHVISSFAYSSQGMLGLPAQVAGSILIGFLIFAGMLVASGAGDFFINLAMALMGRFRGGPAKVAVVASGFFGSLSGSPMANVASTGAVTIPAMKRLGYPPHYAGAIEAVASTGGIIMPPVMGATIFIMVILTGIPYVEVMIAAIIPAILYYFGLLVQVDAYAARVGLKGLPREELPSLLKTLKQGWPYIVVIAFLIFGLIYMRWGVKSALYASGLMFILSFTNQQTMMTPRKLVGALATIGSLVTYMMCVLLPVGFILIGLQITGTVTRLTAQLVSLGGIDIALTLTIAVIVSYLFGMVGIPLIAYVVLAVVAVPAIVGASGLSPLAFHLFLIYYLIMSGITPPVAVCAFIAAGVAGAPLMKTAWLASRLGVVLYFIPFFFIFNPALIMEGPITETLYLFVLCLVGIGFLAAGLEGYLLKLGKLNWWSRSLFIAGGFLIAFPNWIMTIIGTVLTVVVIIIILIRRKVVAEKPIAGSP